MRTLFARWVAIVALVTGIGVGATALPAAADARVPAATTTSSSTTTTTQSAPARVARPADWWL